MAGNLLRARSSLRRKLSDTKANRVYSKAEKDLPVAKT